MSGRSKQADRNAEKRAKKKANAQDDVPALDEKKGGSEGSFAILIEKSKSLVLGACVVKLAPKLPDLLKAAAAPTTSKEDAKEKEEEKPAESNDATEEDAAPPADETPAPPADPESAEDIFATLGRRLQWYNTLGLAEPATAEEAKEAWMTMYTSTLELDWGPRKAKRGNPGLDRVLKNACTYLPQYFHVLLALMCLRAFLFRSWFACLPWLVGYQAASLLVPLEMTKDVPLKFRVAATMAIHGLVLLFFLYEFAWKMVPVIEHIFWLGLIVFHAYVVKPLDSK